MNKSMSLASILDGFKGPVNEEQTWAISFQVIKHVQEMYSDTQKCSESQEVDGELLSQACDQGSSATSSSNHVQDHDHRRQSNDNHHYPRLDDSSQIVLQFDGTVSLDSITSHVNEKEFISSLGIVLYEALDYGCDETEERNLEPSLEQFIEKLTCSGQSDINSDGGGDDEGIERDAGDELTLNSVLVMCINHLEVPSKSLASKNNDLKVSISTAEKHYRAVCRAIVTEAKDLITFLDQIAKGSNQLRNISSDPLINAALDELCVNDWARLWMQLVKDLRNGVRLKKVDPMYRNEGKVCEYEMTPYEMLLDDIRSQRYTLKHVEQQNVISNQVKKDAHSLILEFIRSRPPLKSVNERVLPPTPTKTDCAHDRLMKSIKKEHKLRPTSSLIDRPRRQYASLCNIRESLMESSQGLARLDLNDYPDLGLTQLGYSRRNSTYETRNGRSSVNEQLTPSPASRRRKLIRADIDLDLVCYSDDEDDDSCVVTRRKSVIPTTRASEVNEKTADKCDRRRSFRNLFGFGQSFTWNFKSNS